MKRRSPTQPRGLTLVEMTIAIGVVAVLFGTVVMGIGALTGAKARSSTGELAALIRSLYDTAALSGKTCRLVFELPPRNVQEAAGGAQYRAECAEGAVTMSRDREGQLQEENQERERDEDRPPPERRTLTSGDDEPTLEELMAREQQRVEDASRFSEYTSEEVRDTRLPADVKVSVWTRAQREAVENGVAYVYFFPQGTAERAMIFVEQGDNAWTIDISPLTGRTQVLSEKQEIPRT